MKKVALRAVDDIWIISFRTKRRPPLARDIDRVRMAIGRLKFAVIEDGLAYHTVQHVERLLHDGLLATPPEPMKSRAEVLVECASLRSALM